MGGEHDDGHRHGPAVGAEAAADLEAVHARQRQVEQHHVGLVLGDGAQADLAVPHRHNAVALGAQHALKQLLHLGIILDDADQWRGLGAHSVQYRVARCGIAQLRAPSLR